MLNCLPHNSPLLGNRQVHVQASSSARCADSPSLVEEEVMSSAAERNERDLAELVIQNITQLQQSVANLQGDYADMRAEKKPRSDAYDDLDKLRETFEFQVQDLRMFVAVSLKESVRDGARFQAGLQEVVGSLEQTVSDIQQNLTALLQERDQRDEQLQQAMLEMESRHSLEFDELKTKVEANENTTKQNEDKLWQTEDALASLQVMYDSLEASVRNDHEARSQDIDEMWLQLHRLEELGNHTAHAVRGDLAKNISDTQSSSQQIHSELSETLDGISARVGDVEQEFSKLAEQVKTQCNATDVELWPLEERLDKVEEKLALSALKNEKHLLRRGRN